MINYEDELEVVLWDSLKQQYNIKDNNSLFNYLKYRYFIIKKKNKINNIKKFIDFIFNELNISSYYYKGEKLNFVGDNNLTNIFNNWNKFNDNENQLLNITKNCNKQVNKLKNSINYEDYLLQSKLNALNSYYNLDCKTFIKVKINGFNQYNCDFIENDLSIKLNQLEDNSTTFITENDLEDYLITHLNLIENGLSYLSRQYVLDEGRIDILAKDKNDNIVIIEIKIDFDKKIIWQSLYYPIEIQKKYPNKNIRMLTIMPDYPNYLLEPLNKLNVEKFAYNIKVQSNKIIKLELRKVC